MRHVIAARRDGYQGMIPRLRKATGDDFHLLGRPEELTPERLKALDPEFVFFPHWSTIIPREIHEEFCCVIFHMTDLPYGRGGSPLQNLIVRGHTETKLSALHCISELDAGPVYLKKPMTLEGTAEEIFARGAELVEEMIEEIVKTRPEPVAQEGEVVVFQRRTPDQSNLAGLTDPEVIFDHIRMLDAEGYPHAYLEVGDMRLEFTNALLEGGQVKATVNIIPQPEDGK